MDFGCGMNGEMLCHWDRWGNGFDLWVGGSERYKGVKAQKDLGRGSGRPQFWQILNHQIVYTIRMLIICLGLQLYTLHLLQLFDVRVDVNH